MGYYHVAPASWLDLPLSGPVPSFHELRNFEPFQPPQFEAFGRAQFKLAADRRAQVVVTAAVRQRVEPQAWQAVVATAVVSTLLDLSRQIGVKLFQACKLRVIARDHAVKRRVTDTRTTCTASLTTDRWLLHAPTPSLKIRSRQRAHLRGPATGQILRFPTSQKISPQAKSSVPALPFRQPKGDRYIGRMPNYPSRREALRRLLAQKSLPTLLVTDERNVTYLTGFTGDSSYLLVTSEREFLISDGRYVTQLAEECPELELAIRLPGTQLPEFTAAVIGELGLSALALEADIVTVSFYEKLKTALKSASLANTSGLVESLREIKDEGEIAEIRTAIDIAQRAFGVIRASLRHGRSEKEVADELEYQIRLFGGTCGAFPSIIGVGPRAALPHGRPIAGSRIGDDSFVLIDWGARGRLYHSDLTRVLVTGKLSPQLDKVYGLVLRAQQAAIAAIRPGAIMHDVDAAARAVIEEGGFGKAFNHSLGHGIGLAVHEMPRLAPDQKRPLAAGMVVTVEPGIYLPQWGGVRIEDDVLVTADGCEVLTNVPKQLEACVVT
jgi:Xaa-Pro aminopeptidase